MSRPKKREPITGIGRNPEIQMTVQKSLPLFALWRSELTLAEFKILDTYLSRIDSRKPERRSVRFEKGELEQLLGVKQLKPTDLKERLKHLGTMVQVDDPTKTRSFRLVSLFEQAECEQDENGLWQVDLTCTQTAMKYIFNIENIGYLRYKLRSITSLRSRYAYILYLYLEKNRFRQSWEVDVDELRQILRCGEETYTEYKRFNDLILKKCFKEIHEKTKCRFSYEPIKKGRSVRALRFTLETLPAVEPEQVDYEQLTLPPDDSIEFLRGACCPSGSHEPEFSRAEMEQLFEILICVPESRLPYDPATGTNDRTFKQYHYLSMCYAKMNRIEEKTRIKNRLAYLSEMIRKDAGFGQL